MRRGGWPRWFKRPVIGVKGALCSRLLRGRCTEHSPVRENGREALVGNSSLQQDREKLNSHQSGRIKKTQPDRTVTISLKPGRGPMCSNVSQGLRRARIAKIYCERLYQDTNWKKDAITVY